jgi:adenylate cyclase
MLLGKRTFRIYLLELFLTLFVVILGVMITIDYLATEKLLNEITVDLADESTSRVVAEITEFLGGAEIAARIVASHIKTAELTGPGDLFDRREMVWTWLWIILSELPEAQSIYIGDREGNFLQTMRNPEIASRIIDRNHSNKDRWVFRDSFFNPLRTEDRELLYDPRQRLWFQNTGTEDRIYWGEPYIFKTGGLAGITVTHPVNARPGEKSLVVGVDISLTEISEFLKDTLITENSLMGVFTGEGMVIADSRKIGDLAVEHKILRMEDEWPIITAYFQKYLENPDRKVFAVEHQGQTWLLTIQPVGILNWYVVTGIPKSDLTSKVMEIVSQSFLFALFMLLVSILVVIYIVRRVSTPLYRLSAETQKLELLELDQVQAVKSSIVEIDHLSRSLVSSVEALRAFGRYVPADLVRRLIQKGEGGNLGGSKRELTIFFSDIEGFTTASESLAPEALMLQLSAYFELVSDIIMEEHGTIDKYIGDAVMAFWGAPEAIEDQAGRACMAALRVQEALTHLNEQWRSEGRPVFRTRIGINTDEVVVGNVGSRSRMNYSVIGDGVNLAARLEGLNKQYGTSIMISETTYQKVRGRFHCRYLDEVVVKGKTEAVRIYELIDVSG